MYMKIKNMKLVSVVSLLAMLLVISITSSFGQSLRNPTVDLTRQNLSLSKIKDVSDVAIVDQSYVSGNEIPVYIHEDDAIASVADQNDLDPKSLSIVHSTEVSLPLQKIQLVEYKLWDKAGNVYSIALNQRDGKPVAVERLITKEAQLHSEKYGRIEPRLYDILQSASPDEKINVIIWAKETTEEYSGPERPDPQKSLSKRGVDQLYADVDAYLVTETSRAVLPLVSRLNQIGIRKAKTGTHAPVVYVSLSAKVILEELNQWKEIDTIYLNDVNKPELGVARETITADDVHQINITGDGVRIGQVEVGGRVATDNPNLGNVVMDTTNACAINDDHGTGVAGILVSTHPAVRGIAPDAQLRAAASCGGDTDELFERSEAVADWGASAINLSWGANTNLDLGGLDRFYDRMVLRRWRTIVKSAGNEPCRTGTGNVTSPGLAYNVITVGNFNDNGTVTWADDAMSGCSSWDNPNSTRGDREKPEVSAPGTNITTTSINDPWVNFVNSGTSFAAPMVTGQTALMMQRVSGLQTWPEVNSAVIMATATNNIEGDTRLSEFDGVGGIVTRNADDLLQGHDGGYGGIKYRCNTTSPLNATTMSLTEGATARVVIKWNTHDGYSDYENRPSADLDLIIRDPDGNSVAGSFSWDNAYEIAEFVPAVSGEYTLEINQWRCNRSPRWLGWAWYQPEMPQPGDDLTIIYQVHAKNLGWMNWVSDGATAGTTGQSRRLEAMRAELVNAPAGMDVCYRVHMKGDGWGEPECNGEMAGTTGESRRIEAIEVWLNNEPAGMDICYRVHMKGLSWSGVECNGDMAGTTGQSRRIEAMQIELVP